MSTRTTFCEPCRRLRWVEDWNEKRDEVLSIVLGPCGHVIERTARLEWSIPRRRERADMRLVRGTREPEPVAVS
jgi:hypothetical protein